MIIIFDLVVPCIIYYTWHERHEAQWKRECLPYRNVSAKCPLPPPELNRYILGAAIASFGLGELYILIVRVLRLLRRPEVGAPLLSRSRWELDATSWVYGVAMICALIPFVVGSSKEIPMLYLYSPGVLMAFLAVLMLVTTIPFKIPIGINSHARGTQLRPFIYYACEDFVAVDGLQDREFRARFNHRYETSRPFRRMMLHLTLWWFLGVCIYLGSVSAIIWTLDFHLAFGLSLGTLFGWIFIWAALSYLYFQYEVDRQSRNWANTCS
ncbi:hypothetical protein N7451_012233 [Penicillium sp. IBT 35674x]|nr:hypothetical protein N7451_012233 [Penicillium sp. IBT 35674x]